MKDRFVKLLSLLLALVMTTSLVACGGSDDKNSTTDEKPAQGTDTPADGESKSMVSPIPEGMSYDEESAYVYDAQLGEFKKFYDEALEAGSVSERFALMAIAEAKMLEAAVLLPGTTRGGNYGITRIARRSAPSVLWGSDSDRVHDLIVTTDLIKVEDNEYLRNMWNELKGTGTYAEKAIEYLEGKGYTLKDSYTRIYVSDPKTWDALNSSLQVDTEPLVNTYDGLMEYDEENILQPALAESYEISEDGLTYTFHLREGVTWVDNQGRKVADVKADDFVAGMQHMLDAMAGLEYLVDGIIVNAHEYIVGDIADFSEVGVRALDDHTLQYTLVEPTSYFMTLLGYNVFAPMSRDFFLSKGGAFGAEAYQAAVDSDSYTYGHSPSDIAYCGPYLITGATPENSIVFDANPAYWNKDDIRIHHMVWKYNDGKDPTKAYTDAKNGVIDGCGLTSATVEACKKDGLFEEYSTVSDTDATSFVLFLNMNRKTYANANDSTKCVSPMTDDQKLAQQIALYNVHFRRAIGMGLDIGAYNAQVVGEELKWKSVRNSYTPGEFVALPEEVTVSINGTDKTYAAGTYYGQIMQDQIDADGVKIKVWDAENQTSDGFGGWYDPENAMEELKLAIEEVKEYGLEISPENPVYLDLPAFTASEIYANRANALKQSIETSLQGNVVVNIVGCADSNEWEAAGYLTNIGSDANYSLYDLSGWGPDFGDPSTYLDTLLDEYSGVVTRSMGIY